MKKNSIKIFMILLAFIMFCYSIYQLYSTYRSYKTAVNEYAYLENKYIDKELKELENKKSKNGFRKELKNPVDFSKLKEENADIVAWISIAGLDISYPVTQAKDNDYYLHHTFQKTAHFAGSIFMDFRNKPNLMDKNTIIYGHNMKNGSMFGGLKNLKNKTIYEKYPYFWIYTATKAYCFQIFSCRQITLENNVYTTEYEDEYSFIHEMEDAQANSIVYSERLTFKNSTIVTLSTCTSDDKYRFIVQGKCMAAYETK